MYFCQRLFNTSDISIVLLYNNINIYLFQYRWPLHIDFLKKLEKSVVTVFWEFKRVQGDNDIHHVNAEADLLLHGLVADGDLLRVQPLPLSLTEVLLSRHVTTD